MASEKLISASYLATVIRDDPYIHGRAYARMRDHIDDAPAVDAEEVVHGRWRGETEEEQPHIALRRIVCSVCDGKAFGRGNYCPNCGAKMDGDGNGK